MKNKIEDLRNHLFATLEALQDEQKPMDLDRARAVAEVAKVVVDTARVEVDFLKATGGDTGTGFLPSPAKPMPALPSGGPVSTPRRKCETCRGTTQQDPCEHCGAAWQRVAKVA
jgi:hypothetical protein